MILDAGGLGVSWQCVQFPFQPGNHPAVHPPRIDEDDEKGVSHCGLLVKVVDEPEDALDPGMEDEGCETIEHERAWAPLIEERRGRGPNAFQPTRVHVPDPAV